MATFRTYSATVDDLGALMHLRLDEGSGTDALDSAGSLDGRYEGGVTLGEAGGIGNGAARFDGSSGQVFVATLSGTFTVSAFGDSLIDGDGFQDPPDRFSPVLEAALEARGLDATVLEQAVGGQTTGGGLARVDDIVDENPDVVIVEFGTNDAIGTQPAGEVEDNLEGIIDALQSADIEVLLTGAFAFYPDRGAAGVGYGSEPARDEFEQIFPDLAAETGATLLQDAEGSFQFLGGSRDGTEITGGVLGDPDLQAIVDGDPDGLHPNADGIELIVPRVVPQTIALGAEAGVIDEPLLLANGSFEAWFTPDDVSDTQVLFAKNGAGQGTGGHVVVLIEDGQVAAGLGDGTTNHEIESTDADLEAGQLTHLVFTFGAAGMRLFIDGEEVALTGDGIGYDGGLDAGDGNFEPLTIGSDNGAAHFEGVIDEFAVYDGALSAGQVASLFDAGQAGLTLFGTAAADDMFGGADDEGLRGRAGDDTVLGGAGADELHGGSGNDEIRGGLDDDDILGGLDNDLIYGGGGNDVVRGNPGADRIAGNVGEDELHGGGAGDVVFGNQGSDLILGGIGNDELFGNIGNDEVRGQAGRDLVVGGEDDDELHGGADDDVLDGGPGSDDLFGGLDSDRFVMSSLGDGVDDVFGFQAGPGGDVLDLSAVVDFGGGDVAGDFVQLDESGGNTELAVDADGAGGGFTPLFNLIGVTGLGVDQLVADGNLDLTGATA